MNVFDIYEDLRDIYYDNDPTTEHGERAGELLISLPTMVGQFRAFMHVYNNEHIFDKLIGILDFIETNELQMENIEIIIGDKTNEIKMYYKVIDNIQKQINEICYPPLLKECKDFINNYYEKWY